MKKLQRAAVAAALAAAGLGVVGATANATTAAPAHRTQAAAPSWRGAGSVRANEQVVEAFLQDVINEHNGGDAANFLTPDMQWYGGTVGTVSGRANVAGLFAGVVAALPDAHIAVPRLGPPGRGRRHAGRDRFMAGYRPAPATGRCGSGPADGSPSCACRERRSGGEGRRARPTRRPRRPRS